MHYIFLFFLDCWIRAYGELWVVSSMLALYNSCCYSIWASTSR